MPSYNAPGTLALGESLPRSKGSPEFSPGVFGNSPGVTWPSLGDPSLGPAGSGSIGDGSSGSMKPAECYQDEVGARWDRKLFFLDQLENGEVLEQRKTFSSVGNNYVVERQQRIEVLHNRLDRSFLHTSSTVGLPPGVVFWCFSQDGRIVETQ